MKKEYKALRDQICVAVPNPVMRRSVLLKVGKALRAMREDCAEVAHAEVHKFVGSIAEANREMVANGVADAIRSQK